MFGVWLVCLLDLITIVVHGPEVRKLEVVISQVWKRNLVESRGYIMHRS